jgi:hypothetical protein
MAEFACPHCKAILSPTLLPAKVTPAKLVPEVVVPAQVTGLMLVKPPPAPTPIPTPSPPTPVPVPRKIPFGPFHLPLMELVKPDQPFSSTTLTVDPAKISAQLDSIRGKGSVLLLLSRTRSRDANGLSVEAATAELANWPDLTPSLADGTVLGVYIGDDIGEKEWGAYDMAERLKRFDAIAGAARARWPGVTTVIRAKPEEIKEHTWKNLSVCWAQYRGPQRDGTPEAFRDRNMAGAKALGLELVVWFNTLNGGDGSSKILGTYLDPNPETGKSPNRWQMSAKEVLDYGKVFLPHTKWALHWQYSPTYKSDGLPAAQLAGVRAFDGREDVKKAMAELRTLAGWRVT